MPLGVFYSHIPPTPVVTCSFGGTLQRFTRHSKIGIQNDQHLAAMGVEYLIISLPHFPNDSFQ